MADDTQPTRRVTPVALIGVVPFLILVAWHWPLGPLAQFGDWAQYLLHADALRHGRAYGDIGYIFTSRNPFIGPPVQPPGLPVMLVPLLALTDGARDGAVYKLFMVASALAFLVGIAAYFACNQSRPLALATVLVIGLWLETGFATNTVQPDAPFAAFIWSIFCLVDTAGAWSWRRVAAVTVLGLAALAFRLAALPLVPAVALYALLHRRTLGVRPWVPVAIWCLCGLVALSLMPNALMFARLVPRDPSSLIHHVVQAAKIYPFAVLDLFLYPLPWNHANDAYHVVIAMLAVVGAVAWFPRVRSRFVILFTVVYVGMLLVLPMQDGRYLMPIAPLAVYTAGVGIGVVAAGIGRLTRHPLPPPRAVGVSLAVAIAIVVAALGRQLTQPAPTVLMDVPGVQATFQRLRAAHDSGTVRAMFVNPRVLTWRTGVPAMGFFLADPDTILAELRAKRITHVIVGDLDTDPTRAPAVAATVAARPAAFRRLYAGGPFTVYAFDSAKTVP